MKCSKCQNIVKIKDAKFCPLCGGELVEEIKLAAYTMGQFFSCTGDDEFAKAWEEVRMMDAASALAWLREKPQIHNVYKFFGEWGKSAGSGRSFRRVVSIEDLPYIFKENGRVSAKLYAMTIRDLNEVGKSVFFARDECEEAIKRELDSFRKRNGELKDV